MVNPNRLLGITKVTVNGQSLNLVPNSGSLRLDGLNRTAQPGSEGGGFSGEPVPARLEVTALFGPSTRLGDLREWENETVVAITDLGQRYVMSSAWLESAPEVSFDQGGRVPLVFSARSCEPLEA